MSMSTHVVGFKPTDETFKRMQRAWEACSFAGVQIPDAVCRFFGGVEKPDFSVGVEVDLRNILREWGNDYAAGYEINLDDIPADVKILRFYNAW